MDIGGKKSLSGKILNIKWQTELLIFGNCETLYVQNIVVQLPIININARRNKNVNIYD